MTDRSSSDNIDQVIDQLLTDPNRADEVKSKLRQMTGEAPRHQSRSSRISQHEAELEDLFDNMPV